MDSLRKLAFPILAVLLGLALPYLAAEGLYSVWRGSRLGTSLAYTFYSRWFATPSVPDYDPNAFIPSIAPDRWKAYISNKRLSPFTNRAIASFTPGSTMKVPTAISGALEGMAKKSFS